MYVLSLEYYPIMIVCDSGISGDSKHESHKTLYNRSQVLIRERTKVVSQTVYHEVFRWFQ